jgi:spore coat protein A, manganese oxidase
MKLSNTRLLRRRVMKTQKRALEDPPVSRPIVGIERLGKALPKVLLVLVMLASSLLSPKVWGTGITVCGSPAVQPCVQQFIDPLYFPPTFDQLGAKTTITVNFPTGSQPVDTYDIAARPFSDHVLSGAVDGSGNPLMTTLWGFGPNGAPKPTPVCKTGASTPCFSSPAPTIVTPVDRHVQVKWINDLEINGHFVTYPAGVPVSTDNHWANPPRLCDNGPSATDCKGSGGNYLGPVPLVVHAHGEISASDSDGIPEAWNLPAASTAGYSTGAYFPFGSDFCQRDPTKFGTSTPAGRDPNCGTTTPSYLGDGAARFEYPNTQFATTLFFHDHALGVTTQNVYMGLAGFLLLRGTVIDPTKWCHGAGFPCTSFSPSDDLPGDPATPGGLPQGDCSAAALAAVNLRTQVTPCHELALAITDKAFNTDGSLRFSESGNIILVNGHTWPFLNVEPRKYRVRIVISAPTSRFVFMFPDTTSATLTQIGSDGGFLPHPAKLKKLSMMPGERADLIFDFSSFGACAGQPNCTVNLLNDNGGGNTGQVMQFRILPFASGRDTSCNLPSILTCTSADTLPHRTNPNPVNKTVQVSLFDNFLGTCGSTTCSPATPQPWDGPTTESPNGGDTEVWEMFDFEDSHPMHLHEAQFEVVNRENTTTHAVYNCSGTAVNNLGQTVNCSSPPVPGETGFKDTVAANVGITRVRVAFFGPEGNIHHGLFAWHCHINPHEDNEMMRPMCVVDPLHPPVTPTADGFAGCPSDPN